MFNYFSICFFPRFCICAYLREKFRKAFCLRAGLNSFAWREVVPRILLASFSPPPTPKHADFLQGEPGPPPGAGIKPAAESPACSRSIRSAAGISFSAHRCLWNGCFLCAPNRKLRCGGKCRWKPPGSAYGRVGDHTLDRAAGWDRHRPGSLVQLRASGHRGAQRAASPCGSPRSPFGSSGSPSPATILSPSFLEGLGEALRPTSQQTWGTNSGAGPSGVWAQWHRSPLWSRKKESKQTSGRRFRSNQNHFEKRVST